MSSSSSSLNHIIPANVVGNLGQYAVKGFDLRACIDANGNLEVGRLQLLLNAVGAATIPRLLAEILNKAGHNIPSARTTEDNNEGHGRPPAKKMRAGINYGDHIAQDPDNERGEFGRSKLIPPERKWPAPFNRPIVVGGKQYFADGVFTNKGMEQIVVLYKTTGQPHYDAEQNALGPISEDEFLRIPNCLEISVCKTRKVCTPYESLDERTLEAIYGLARKQADKLKIRQPERWALLRMIAVALGWFNHQPEVKKVRCNIEEMSRLFAKDDRGEALERLMEMAAKLCQFIPYFVELWFRAYGSGFVGNSKPEFMKRARRLAASTEMEDCLGYMDENLLFGNCLRWIGVKRPMEVLKLTPPSRYICEFFLIRAKDAPAGLATIATALAVIKRMNLADCWEPIKQYFGLADDAIIAAAEEICRDPWKYHMHSSAYGVASPSEDEKRTISRAKDQVKKCAFILQAYVETISEESALSDASDLKRIADIQRVRVDMMKSTFKSRGVRVFAEWQNRMREKRLLKRDGAGGNGG